jgi:small subunit ribosomal protein S8
MGMTDPIADLLTRIRNGVRARKEHVDAPYSQVKTRILDVMKDEGYIRDLKKIQEGTGGAIRVYLRYDARGVPAISGIQRLSTPGLRKYVGADDIPDVRHGLGVTILSTPQGIMADRKARQSRVGGELLLSIW